MSRDSAELAVALGKRLDDVGVRLVLPLARLVGQPDEAVGALRHVADEAVVADGHVDQPAHVVAIALQRVGRLLRGGDMAGIAHDAGEPDQVEARLLGVGQEQLVKARSARRASSRRKSSRAVRAERRLR